MPRAIKALFVLLAWPLLTSLLLRAAHAAEPRILVLDVDAPSLAPAARSTFARGLETGLSASGASVVSTADAAREVAAPDGTCADVACWARLQARDAGLAVAYVARSSVALTGSTYQLRVEMLDPRTARVVEARDDACEICTVAEAADALGMTASAAKVAAFKRGSAGAELSGQPPAGAVVATHGANPTAGASATAASGGTIVKAAASDTSPASGSSRSGSATSAGTIVGWTMVAAGAVAVAAGVVMLELDGKCSGSSPCPNIYHLKAAGLATGISGLVVGLVGGGILLAGPSTRDGRIAGTDGGTLSWRRAF